MTIPDGAGRAFRQFFSLKRRIEKRFALKGCSDKCINIKTSQEYQRKELRETEKSNGGRGVSGNDSESCFMLILLEIYEICRFDCDGKGGVSGQKERKRHSEDVKRYK